MNEPILRASAPTALYRNREGEVWPLVDVVGHPHCLGLVYARRQDTGETVVVQRREIQNAEGGTGNAEPKFAGNH